MVVMLLFVTMKTTILLSTLLSFTVSAAPTKVPDQPYGNPNATVGGTFYIVFATEPPTLNYFSSADIYSSIIQGNVLESLLGQHPDTYEWVPGLAEKWAISKDGKRFTFTLRSNAKFHDGKPVTVQDVKFSFDAIFKPEYNAAIRRVYYEDLASCEILDEHTVRFTAKEKYFRNFDSAAGLRVLPQHVYGDPEKAKTLNTTLVGSGSYMLESFDRGNRIVLKRNPDWWGWSVPLYKGTSNFNRIWYRFQSQENIRLEMLKKGDLDYLDEYSITPELYFKKAEGPEWGKTVAKEKVSNKSEKPFNFVGWNLRRPLFADRNVRIALAHLMNREFMIEKFRYGLSVPATGPWHLYSDYASKKVQPLNYDPKKASELLAKAGWKDTDGDGLLDKVINGKKVKFSFTVLYANPDREKYLTVYKEDLKKAGINMELNLVEWNTFNKLVSDEHNFDAVNMAWGGGAVDLDPKQIWHSSSDSVHGSNFVGYHSSEVDKLIDQAREELNKPKRIKILQKVYEKIADDAPYAFMFNEKFVLYMHTTRVKMVKPTYNYAIGNDTWWAAP